ncbi:MAG: polyprenyl synthetase [Peptococcaceae bacterium]|nr:polyprenyl synthetase [Peptococcaceae bacterium]
MNPRLDQVIFREIDKILKKTRLGTEMDRMIRVSLNAESKTGELFKWAHLTCMSCKCVGGNEEAALPGAMAMEFFALAADIFDDIQDKDHEDLPWRKIPEANAINLATCLLMLSSEAISSIKDDRVFREISTTLYRTGIIASNGQFREFLYEGQQQVTLEQYFEMVRQKAGSLTSCACKIGAILGGAPKELVELLAELGIYFGIKSQIWNDLNDFLDFSKKKDFICNKKTLPYVYLLNTLKDEKAEQFKELTQWKGQGIHKFGNEEKEKLKLIATEEGVTPFCTVMYEIYRQKAQEILEGISVPEKQKEKMKELVEEIV